MEELPPHPAGGVVPVLECMVLQCPLPQHQDIELSIRIREVLLLLLEPVVRLDLHLTNHNSRIAISPIPLECLREDRHRGRRVQHRDFRFHSRVARVVGTGMEGEG